MTTYGPHGNNFQFLTTMVATFIGDNFLGVNFLGVIFLGAIFKGAIFRGGKFQRGELSQGAIFLGEIFQRAIFGVGGGAIFTEPRIFLYSCIFYARLLCNVKRTFCYLQIYLAVCVPKEKGSSKFCSGMFGPKKIFDSGFLYLHLLKKFFFTMKLTVKHP